MPALQWMVAGRRIGSFRAWGFAGLGAAIGWVTLLARAGGVRPSAPLLVTVASVAAFLIAVKLSVVAFGEERIVFYEKALAALGACALVLWLAGRPLGDGLDLATIGILVFLAVGRLGCYQVGCCHGRPAGRGVRYGRDHGTAGFPASLVDVPLFPIQLVESVLVLALAIGGTILTLFPHRPGEPTAVLLSSYGVVRSLLELQRGDRARPIWWGVSEAQWTALLVAWTLVGLARRGALTFWPLYLAAAVALTLLCAALVLGRRRLAWTRWGLGAPAHVAELSRLVGNAVRDGALTAFTTSLGARITHGRDGRRHHYALSRADRRMSAREARALAGWIRLLQRGLVGPIQPGVTAGIYHLVAEEEGSGGGPVQR